MTHRKQRPSSSFSSKSEAASFSYTCAECGGAADVGEDGVYRHCGHFEASVKAHLSAVVFGEGKAAH